MTRRSLNKLRKNVRRRLRGKRDFDLATSKGRRGAYWDLYASDHGFLRLLWTNRRPLGDQMVRYNQPSPARIRRLAAEGVRTIINLRAGHIPAGKTGILDHFFHTYLEDAVDHPMPLLEWVDKRYDPVRLKATFQTRWWGTLLSERLLNRE